MGRRGPLAARARTWRGSSCGAGQAAAAFEEGAGGVIQLAAEQVARRSGEISAWRNASDAASNSANSKLLVQVRAARQSGLSQGWMVTVRVTRPSMKRLEARIRGARLPAGRVGRILESG
jgi:hypothetical protein